MHGFEARRPPKPGEEAVSIKVRVVSGCFHREHSPRAYELIDRGLAKRSNASFSFEEHESGPEILVYLAVTAAALGLTNSIVDLITTIIEARSEGIKKGDRPSDPVELIVRRVFGAHGFREEIVLRVGHKETTDKHKIEQHLKDALRKLLDKDSKSSSD